MKEAENLTSSSILTSKRIHCIFIWNQYGMKIGQLKNIESQTNSYSGKLVAFHVYKFTLVKDLERRSEL